MNILVYSPKKPRKRLDLNWIYGLDIIQKLKKKHSEWNFLVADGTRSEESFFDGIDVYLRPSRCDGWAIMVKEAEYCDIPTIWSFETGDFIEPDIDDIEARLVEIQNNLIQR